MLTPSGGASAPAPRLAPFLAGSAPQATVTAPVVWLTVRTAPFQVPNTALGATAVPPYCQSPLRLLGSLVMSVRNSEGAIGRPDKSVPAWSPVVAVVPTAGLRAAPGFEVSAAIG